MGYSILQYRAMADWIFNMMLGRSMRSARERSTHLHEVLKGVLECLIQQRGRCFVQPRITCRLLNRPWHGNAYRQISLLKGSRQETLEPSYCSIVQSRSDVQGSSDNASCEQRERSTYSPRSFILYTSWTPMSRSRVQGTVPGHPANETPEPRLRGLPFRPEAHL